MPNAPNSASALLPNPSTNGLALDQPSARLNFGTATAATEKPVNALVFSATTGAWTGDTASTAAGAGVSTFSSAAGATAVFVSSTGASAFVSSVLASSAFRGACGAASAAGA